MSSEVKIKNVLVTQPEPQDKSPYHDLAKKNNWHIDFRAFVEIEGVAAKEFRKSKINILDYSAVIFTSKTPVDHYFRLCQEMRLQVPETMKYFCFSEQVAFYLQKYIQFRKRKIFYGKGTFDDLSDMIKKHAVETYLLPVSEGYGPEIPEKLDKLKIKYSPSVMYRTVNSNLTDMQQSKYDLMIFYSPAGVQSLVHNFPEFAQNGLLIASFGPATAKAVKDAGLRLDIQAPLPHAPSMTMAIELYMKEHSKKGTKTSTAVAA